MAKKIKSFDELRVDVFQAIKRAYMRKGVVPMPEKPPAQRTKAAKPKTNKSAALSEDKQEVITAESANVIEKPSIDKDEREAQQGPEKLAEMTEKTHEVLYEATTVFPFTLVPDTVRLDREKLTIAHRVFWRMADITSVPVSEVLSVVCNVGPFFGSLHLIFSFFADNERTVTFLWRKDAIELHRLVHGYIIAHKREINTSNIEIEDLKVLLRELGQGSTD